MGPSSSPSHTQRSVEEHRNRCADLLGSFLDCPHSRFSFDVGCVIGDLEKDLGETHELTDDAKAYLGRALTLSGAAKDGVGYLSEVANSVHVGALHVATCLLLKHKVDFSPAAYQLDELLVQVPNFYSVHGEESLFEISLSHFTRQYLAARKGDTASAVKFFGPALSIFEGSQGSQFQSGDAFSDAIARLQALEIALCYSAQSDALTYTTVEHLDIQMAENLRIAAYAMASEALSENHPLLKRFAPS